LFLVQLWFQPFFDGSSWDGPAWSISAEWLAYLLFGGLVLIIFRLARATRARTLLWLAFAVTLPPVMFLLASGHFYTPWSWLPRILMQFTAGAIACAAVRRLNPSDRTRTLAGVAAVLLVAALIGALYWFDAHPIPDVIDSGGVLDLLFVPLVVTLAIGSGTLPALLSVRVLTYGGQISFSLYMVHEIVHTAWNWAVLQFELTLTGPAGRWILLGLFAIAFAAAAALYHFVEEPARRWMRRMVDVKDAPPAVQSLGRDDRKLSA
jgi:peptidoglycan/LPS O-acetylase OafA/YrhL